MAEKQPPGDELRPEFAEIGEQRADAQARKQKVLCGLSAKQRVEAEALPAWYFEHWPDPLGMFRDAVRAWRNLQEARGFPGVDAVRANWAVRQARDLAAGSAKDLVRIVESGADADLGVRFRRQQTDILADACAVGLDGVFAPVLVRAAGRGQQPRASTPPTLYNLTECANRLLPRGGDRGHRIERVRRDFRHRLREHPEVGKARRRWEILPE